MAKIRPWALYIFFGEIIVTALTVLATLAFIGSSLLIIIRNVLLLDILFLIIYVLWLKIFGNYEKIYKAGLKEE